MAIYIYIHIYIYIYTHTPCNKKRADKKPGSERDAAIFFLSLRTEGLDLPEQIYHEIALFYESDIVLPFSEPKFRAGSMFEV